MTTYQFEELFAEKIRALVERTRPRDLYDIVFILENHTGETDLRLVRDVYERKCAAKGLAVARGAEILALAGQAGELRSEWENMLAHQLPELPPLDSVLSRLEALLGWVDVEAPAPAPTLPSVAVEIGSELVAPLGVTFWGGGSQIEVIRFAGANRLLVEFTYHAKHRVVEPYSLRRARTGNLLLYAWEQSAGHIKAFTVAEIRDARATRTPFSPRFVVELAAGGGLHIRPTAARAGLGRPSARPARPSGWHTPRYVFQCPQCMKEFRHAKNDPTLRRHRNSYGSLCPGRRGHLLRTE